MYSGSRYMRVDVRESGYRCWTDPAVELKVKKGVSGDD